MTLESVLVEMNRKINTLQTKVNEHDRRLIRAPLHAGASKVLAIASGAVEATRPYIHLVPETGITDTLDSITNGSDGKMIIIANSRVGDTIMVNPFSVGGGNIDLNGSATPYVLDDIHDSLTFIYRGDTSHWEQIGASGGGSGGAVDSVNGQTGVVVLDTDDIAEGIANLWFTAAEETKLAGIEALADVTDAANMAAAIIAQPGKTTPIDTDIFPGLDSADTYQIKEFSWADIKTALTTLFSGLYVALLGDQNVDGIKTFINRIVVASTATAGAALSVVRDLTSTSTDSPVVSVVQDHASDDQVALYVRNDGPEAAIHAEGASPLLITRPTTTTSTLLSTLIARLATSADMIDGFGPTLALVIRDSAGIDNIIGTIGAGRYVSDDRGRIQIQPYYLGAPSLGLTVTNFGVGINNDDPSGVLSMFSDANGGPTNFNFYLDHFDPLTTFNAQIVMDNDGLHFGHSRNDKRLELETDGTTRLRIEGTGAIQVLGDLQVDDNLTATNTAVFSSSVIARNFYSFATNLADDTVLVHQNVGGGMIILSTAISNLYAIVHFRCPAARFATPISVGPNVNCTTGTLTGTTGVDGKFTISVNNPGSIPEIYFENRTGATLAIRGYITGA